MVNGRQALSIDIIPICDRIDEVFEIDVYPYTAAFGRYRDNRQFKGEHILDLKTWD